jgi:hypothetical protein
MKHLGLDISESSVIQASVVNHRLKSWLVNQGSTGGVQAITSWQQHTITIERIEDSPGHLERQLSINLENMRGQIVAP